MVRDLEPVMPTHVFLEGLDLRLEEFDDLSAFHAEKMVMVFPGLVGFEVALAVTPIDLPGQAAFHQVLQGAVNRGKTHFPTAGGMAVQILRRHVALQVQKGLQQTGPLGSPTEFFSAR